MRYSLTILEQHMKQARAFCFSKPECEGACFLLCGTSQTEGELRLLCREVLPVPLEAYLERRPDFLSLDSSSYVHVAKRARAQGLSIIFVHSHPGGYLAFSEQDDQEEPQLQDFFASRAPNTIHGALVLTDDDVVGRIWRDGFEPMSMIRVVGSRFLFRSHSSYATDIPDFYDRQVRAFGPAMQAMLQNLHVGVVGAGGTGSAVIEQLTRLGVGTLSIFDGDTFEVSNVNRLYGSGAADEGLPKVQIAVRNVAHVGVGTTVRPHPTHITEPETARAMRDCDLIFGCTDKQAPRMLLSLLSTHYLIPVIDTGVLISSAEGRITDITGRVTTIYPGEACLYCRNRIDPQVVRFELLPEEQQERERADGYAPELPTRSPAVITFTTPVASAAVTELLHRLTGFMGVDRQSTELLLLFDKGRVTRSRQEVDPDCQCADPENWGSGDSERFLGVL